jgi:hypothetical protein
MLVLIEVKVVSMILLPSVPWHDMLPVRRWILILVILRLSISLVIPVLFITPVYHRQISFIILKVIIIIITHALGVIERLIIIVILLLTLLFVVYLSLRTVGLRELILSEVFVFFMGRLFIHPFLKLTEFLAALNGLIFLSLFELVLVLLYMSLSLR